MKLWKVQIAWVLLVVFSSSTFWAQSGAMVGRQLNSDPHPAPSTTPASAQEHEQDDEDSGGEAGIPGDDEIIEILHFVERMKEVENPIWPFLVGAMFTMWRVHSLLHSLHEVTARRREMLEKADEMKEEIHEKKHLMEEAAKLQEELKRINAELTRTEQDLKKQLGDLRNAGKNLKGQNRADFDKFVAGVEKRAADRRRPFSPVRTLHNWAKTEAGRQVVNHPSVKPWMTKFEADAARLRDLQKSFYQNLMRAESVLRTSGVTASRHYELTRPGEPGSRLRVQDDAQVNTETMTRNQAMGRLGRLSSQCADGYESLVNRQGHSNHQTRFSRYYTTLANYRGVMFDAGSVGIGVGLSLGAYEYFRRNSGGQDAFHHELNRKLNFMIDWNAKADILTQLTSEQGHQDIQPITDSVYQILNSQRFANRIRDAVHEALKRKGMGDEAIEHEVARIEDKDTVGAAVAVGLATTPREIGAWYMTKDQMLQTLRSDNKTTPVYRDLFIEKFMDKLPGWLWPSVAQHGLPLDERAKRELVDAFRAELEHLTQENKIRNNQRRAIPVPGQTPSAGHH